MFQPIERIHADDTTVPGLAKGKTRTGRLWTYVRDDRPFAGPDPPAAVFFYSPDRGGAHPEQHLAGYAGLMQADTYAGFGRLYEADRKGGPIIEAAWCGLTNRPTSARVIANLLGCSIANAPLKASEGDAVDKASGGPTVNR